MHVLPLDGLIAWMLGHSSRTDRTVEQPIMPQRMHRKWAWLPRQCGMVSRTVACFLSVTGPALAGDVVSDIDDTPTRDAPLRHVEEAVVTYPAAFFARYGPNTALDMVRQVPGFQLDDGDEQRGFGGAAGNLLINGRYPSSKQDKPSEILERIPADQVERIELIRGQVREIDLRGRAAVVNLVLAEDMQAASRWELSVRKNFKFSPLAPRGSFSVSDQWRGIEYNIGIDGRRASYGDPGFENVLDGSGMLMERRIDDHEGTGYDANGYFIASGWLGNTLWHLNSTLGFEVRDEVLNTRHIPETPGSSPTEEFFLTRRDNRTFEIGMGAERTLHPDLLGKAILLFFRLDQDPSSSQLSLDGAGHQTLFRKADTNAEATESIGRLELDWTGLPEHVVQVNLEVARNVLDSALVQVVDTGRGPERVPVPGANTRVEELRGDLLINDTWSFGNFELDYGLGMEASQILQTGDAELERSFFFAKPHAALTYAPSLERRTRVRVAREVSQLDFGDFVSATVFEDNDLALGNPDLRPETTWIAELSQEQRFGKLSVIKLTAFHHWISDVQDLLPLTSTLEAPGNIGDGRRWGMELETTLPLEWLGIAGARLDLKARWQDSTVEDPVTGKRRVLSAEGGHDGDVRFRDANRYALLLDYRQDFEEARVSWGWDYAIRAERPLFKVNELDIYDEATQLNAFMETTRWFGLKIRLSGMNLLDIVQSRDRTVYSGERSISPVAFRELRYLTNGTRVVLGLSGAF